MPEGHSLERWLLARWYDPAPPPLSLRLLAHLYGAALVARRALYACRLLRARRVGVPVVVVGNVTVGGTGKSPLTAWIASRLRERGHHPGIASRGYGRSGAGLRLVSSTDTAAEVGDEPLMLHRETGVPVCVAARRADAAERLVTAGCDFVICDDGLQHLALARDLELAVLDGARGLGNGWLLPAGPLREPAGRLSEVAAVVVNGARAVQQGPAVARELHMSLAAGPLRAVAGEAGQPLEWLRGRAVHAVTGIGNPERFFGLLRTLGAEVREHAFGDHHRFVAGDIHWPDALPVIMTAKDAVKCLSLAGARHWYLPVAAMFPRAEEDWLTERILALATMEGPLRD
jgi:tetraacyldisaccharide 4'-kinase